MSQSLVPPGITEDPPAASILVVAPHYDDEVLGCGGLVSRKIASGAVVRVLFLSESGAEAAGDRKVYAARRREEAAAAAKVLGLAGADHLSLPDGRLSDHLSEIGAGLRRSVLAQRPDLILVPSPLEVSEDHRAAFRALHDLLSGARRGDEMWPVVEGLVVLTFEVNHPLYPNLLVDVSDQIDILRQAMACYGSQQERHDYLGACLGLRQFRALTLAPEVEYAEAYRRLESEDFRTRSRSRLIHHLGGRAELFRAEEGPMVSVIIRTKDRPELLMEALESLGASSYRRFEVLIVNDGGAPPLLPAELSLQARTIDLPENLGRAGAANAGLEAANGDYVSFLDDDDLVDPEHLETLVGLVSAAGVRVAYSDAAVGVYSLDGDGWSQIERRLPYSRDFDSDLLLFDNYIPFHTLIFDRSLLEEVGELDISLPFFEDWDFLIRLASKAPFHHLSRVTCEYRQFRGGGHHVLGDRPRERSDFLSVKSRVIDKHRSRWSADLLSRVVDGLRGEAVVAHEDQSRLLREKEEQVAAFHRLRGRQGSLELHAKVLEESERRSREELRTSHRAEQAATEEIARLNSLIKAMESTKAWRAHRWVERIRGRRPER